MKTTDERVTAILAKAASRSAKRRHQLTALAAAAALILVASPLLLRFVWRDLNQGPPGTDASVLVAAVSDDATVIIENFSAGPTSMDTGTTSTGTPEAAPGVDGLTETTTPTSREEVSTPTSLEGVTTPTSLEGVTTPTSLEGVTTPTSREASSPLVRLSDETTEGVRREVYSDANRTRELIMLSAQTGYPEDFGLVFTESAEQETDISGVSVRIIPNGEEKFVIFFTRDGSYFSARSQGLAKAEVITFLTSYLS